MKRTAFGEPRPGTFEEILAAIEEVFEDGAELQAQIFDGHYEPPPFHGFTAEVSDAENGEPRFSTLGFPDKEDLIEALNRLGVVLIEDCT